VLDLADPVLVNAENAGLENAGLDFGGPNSKAGKCRTGIWRTK